MATSPEEQFRTENDHEALVSVKNFKLAQMVVRTNAGTARKSDERNDTGGDAVAEVAEATESGNGSERKPLLSGLLRCGKCHRMMVINGEKTAAHCGRERMLGDTAEPVSMSLIEAKTTAMLNTKAKLAKKLLGQDVEIPDVDGIEAEIASLKKDLMERYETFADGKISKEKYIAFRDKNKARTAEMEQKLSLARGRKEYLIRRKETLEPLAGIVDAELTREMLLRTVDAVYWDDGEVQLKLKADEFLDA